MRKCFRSNWLIRGWVLTTSPRGYKKTCGCGRTCCDYDDTNFCLLQQAATAITPNHSRTGSSPAVIQQPVLAQQAGNPATRWASSSIRTKKFLKLSFPNRTNTYPKIPERFRLRSTDGTSPMAQIGAQLQSPSTPNKIRSVSLHGQSTTTPLLTKVSPNNHLNNSNNKTNDNSKDGKEQSKEEEVIYFWYKPTEVEI